MHLFCPGIAFITITGLPMNFTIEIEQEEDGRFLAEVIGFPGVLAFGEFEDFGFFCFTRS